MRTTRVAGAPFPTPWRRHLRTLARQAGYRVLVGCWLLAALECLYAMRGVVR